MLAPPWGQVGDEGNQPKDGALLQVNKPHDQSGGSLFRGKTKGLSCPGSEGIRTQRGATPKKPSPRSLCFIEGRLLLSSNPLWRVPPNRVSFTQRLRVPRVSLCGLSPNADGHRDKDFTLSVPHFLCLEKKQLLKVPTLFR